MMDKSDSNCNNDLDDDTMSSVYNAWRKHNAAQIITIIRDFSLQLFIFILLFLPSSSSTHYFLLLVCSIHVSLMETRMEK
jgi:hypothetical protein